MSLKGKRALVTGSGRSLGRAITHELAPFGVTCNHGGPGLLDTEPRQNKYYPGHKARPAAPWGPEERLQEVPMKRLGTPEELAALCAFLPRRRLATSPARPSW